MLKEKNAFVTLDVTEMMGMDGGNDGTVGAMGNIGNMVKIIGEAIGEAADWNTWRIHTDAGCPNYHECALGMPEDCPLH